MRAAGEIVERIGPRQGEFLFVCPHFAGLWASEADLVGCLPIGDANGATLALARALPDDPGIYAGILAADPFRPAPALLSALKDAGIRSIINLPTVAMITDGLAEALSHAGIDYAAELATLTQATALGLNTFAVVTTSVQAGQAIAAGIRRVLVYPVADGDPAMRRRRVAAAMEAVDVMRALTARPTILAFRHPDYGGLLDPLLAAADGVVDWAVAARP